MLIKLGNKGRRMYLTVSGPSWKEMKEQHQKIYVYINFKYKWLRSFNIVEGYNILSSLIVLFNAKMRNENRKWEKYYASLTINVKAKTIENGVKR